MLELRKSVKRGSGSELRYIGYIYICKEIYRNVYMYILYNSKINISNISQLSLKSL